MYKILFKIFFIILLNLLAFLAVGLILDALFKTEGKLVLASILVSLPVLGLIMYKKAEKILEELQKISAK